MSSPGLVERLRVTCPGTKSDMTPCVARDGVLAVALTSSGAEICVGCERLVSRLSHTPEVDGLETTEHGRSMFRGRWSSQASKRSFELSLLRDFDRLTAEVERLRADLAAANAAREALEHDLRRSNTARMRTEAQLADAVKALGEADLWLKATLNLVEGDGMPPNWDGIRTFRQTVAALKETGT